MVKNMDDSFVVEVAVKMIDNTWENRRIEVTAANENEALLIAEQDIFDYVDEFFKIIEARSLYVITDL